MGITASFAYNPFIYTIFSFTNIIDKLASQLTAINNSCNIELTEVLDKLLWTNNA